MLDLKSITQGIYVTSKASDNVEEMLKILVSSIKTKNVFLFHI